MISASVDGPCPSFCFLKCYVGDQIDGCFRMDADDGCASFRTMMIGLLVPRKNETSNRCYLVAKVFFFSSFYVQSFDSGGNWTPVCSALLKFFSSTSRKGCRLSDFPVISGIPSV